MSGHEGQLARRVGESREPMAVPSLIPALCPLPRRHTHSTRSLCGKIVTGSDSLHARGNDAAMRDQWNCGEALQRDTEEGDGIDACSLPPAIGRRGNRH